MATFELSLNQVNFEEQDLSPNSLQDLHSFGNLVSYDSDFIPDSSTKGGLPIVSRKVKNGTNQIKKKSEEKRSFDNQEVHRFLKVTAQDLAKEEQESLSDKDSSMSGESNSFTAFTQTVEALALQKSVIGGNNVAPASAEEIAKAIEGARSKIKTNTEEFSLSDTTGNSQHPTYTPESSNYNKYTNNSLVQSPENSLHLQEVGSMFDGLVLSHSGERDALTSTPRQTDIFEKIGSPRDVDTGTPRRGSTESSRSNISQGSYSELIRMPQDRISISSSRGEKFERPAKRGDKKPGTGHSPPNKTNMKSDEHQDLANGSPTGEVAVGSEACPNLSQGLGEYMDPQSLESSLDGSYQQIQTNAEVHPEPVEILHEYGEQNHVAPSLKEREVQDFFATEQSPNFVPYQPRTSVTEANDVSETQIKKDSNDRQLKVEMEGETISITAQGNVTASKSVTLEGGDASREFEARQMQNHEIYSDPRALEMSSEQLLELDRLRKENAKLGGQIEILELEAKSAISERSDLQSKVAMMKMQMKNQEQNTQGLAGAKNALLADLDILKQNRTRLEQVVMDAQRLIEDKDSDIKALQDELQCSKDSLEKQQERMANSKKELNSKDGTVQDLKQKITELYVQFQTTNQGKILADKEISSLKGELKALGSTKDWYQDQLNAAQEKKTFMQKEIMTIQEENIAHTTSVERLKAENVRAKRNITEMQQRVLQEKESLAQHLEAIEADMMEREAAFLQVQRERDALEKALKEQGGKMPQNIESLENDTKEELRKAQNELKKTKAQVACDGREISELTKRLTLAQESILERDKIIESLERKFIDAEIQLKQTQKELGQKDNDMLQLTDNKNRLEIELGAAKEEKKTFDSALQVLKDDMSKVEKSFKQMKQDIAAKNDEVERVKNEKKKLMKQIAKLKAKEYVQEPQKGIDETDSRILPEPAESPFIDNEVQASEEFRAETPKAENAVEDLTINMDNLDDQSKAIAIHNEQLKNALLVTRQENDKFIKMLQYHKFELEKKVEKLTAALQERDQDIVDISKEKDSAEQQYILSKERVLELELNKNSPQKAVSSPDVKASESVDEDVDSEELTRLAQENEQLRTKVAEIDRERHKEVAKQRSTSLQLGKELEHSSKELRALHKKYEVEKAEYEQKLEDLTLTKTRLTDDLQATQDRFDLTLDEQTADLNNEVQKSKVETESLREEKQKADQELFDLKKETLEQDKILNDKILDLEEKLASLNEFMQNKNETEDKNRQLALDLERERGRFAAVMQSNATLKEHVANLEANLAQKESSVTEISSNVERDLASKDSIMAEMKERLKEMQENLDREKKAGKATKKQLMTERGKHIETKRNTEKIWVELDQLKVDNESKAKDLEAVSAEFELMKRTDVSRQEETDHLRETLDKARKEQGQLENDMRERMTKDPVVQEQVQTLTWELEKRKAEFEALREQLSLVDKRKQEEVQSAQNLLQSSHGELNGIRTELSAVKQERLSLQNKVADLKTALKSTIQASKGGATSLPIDMEALEKLLQDEPTMIPKSKPLSFLQETLSGLRGEISNLQHQVDEHTTSAKYSSMAWKELEEQVKDLRDLCKTSAADRAAASGGGKSKQPQNTVPKTNSASPPEQKEKKPMIRTANLAPGPL